MVKLQAIILGALLACNINTERILTAVPNCQSCATPDNLCAPPPMPVACGPQVLNNNVVQGAGNYV